MILVDLLQCSTECQRQPVMIPLHTGTASASFELFEALARTHASKLFCGVRQVYA